MVITKYKTQQALITKAFNPDVQTYYLANVDKAYTDNSVPTLKQANEAFGNGTASSWLVGQLGNLSEFCGCKDKLDDKQIASLANNIAASYKNLKMSELLLFFGWFKTGHYGHFYGAVDPIVITSALRDFVDERACALQRIYNQSVVQSMPELPYWIEKRKREPGRYAEPNSTCTELTGAAALKAYLMTKSRNANKDSAKCV